MKVVYDREIDEPISYASIQVGDDGLPLSPEVQPEPEDSIWERLGFALAALVILPVFGIVAGPMLAWRELRGK